MKNIALLLLPVLAASLNAGELVPAQVPVAAKWLLHADFDAMRASETGKAVFARIEADHGAKLRAFKRMFSIHLLNDVHGVTLFGDGEPDHAVLLIHGKFDRPHIEDVMKAADGYSEAACEGMTILTWKDKGVIQHAAFAGRDLLVFSRQDGLLRQELLTLKTNAPAPADPFFAAAGGKPLIAACAKLAEIGMPADSARILHLASGLKLAATEHDGHFSIRMAAESANATDADRLRRMLDGVVAFAETGNPDLDQLHLRWDLAATKEKPGMTAALGLPLPEWLALMAREAARKN